MKKIKFLREGLKNLQTVGTLTRSSKSLCRNIVRNVRFDNSSVLVELGAGDGVITKYILDNMAPESRLLAFEVNDKFCDHLREIDDDRLIVIEDTAEKLTHYMDVHSIGQIDQVVSAIPFTVLPRETSRAIIELCRDNLREDGQYLQVHYSLMIKKLYKEIFEDVNVHFVPLNFPPAFLLECSLKAVH